jgi:hypothetical protein
VFNGPIPCGQRLPGPVAGKHWSHTYDPQGKEIRVIGILIAILVAALVYWICVAVGLPSIVAIIAAILVLLAGIPTGGYGLGGRFGGR